jgi:hypothetical protein
MRKFLVALVVLPLACDDADSVPAPGTCAEDRVLAGACTGVPPEALAAPACARTAANDAELGAALAAAASGECVLVKPGSYAAVTLPDGVSLVGESADTVSLAGLTVSSGTLDVLNLSVDGTVTVSSGSTRFAAVRIRPIDTADDDDMTDGLVIAAGASATLEQSEILGAPRYGINASGTLEMTQSLIEGGKGPGVVLAQPTACTSESKASGSLRGSIFRGNALVAISLVGADVVIENVLVTDTVKRGFYPGFGVSISECSTVVASDLTIRNSTSVGLLVDHASLELERATIDGNVRGLWAQRIAADQNVTIRASSLSLNQGVGVGIGDGAVNVLVEDTAILDTQLVLLPGKAGGPNVEVADGVTWLDASTVTLKNLTIERSQRMGILIDGPASGSIDDLALTTTDGSGGVVQQNVPDDGESPDTSGTTPPVDRDQGERFPVPGAVIPPSI